MLMTNPVIIIKTNKIFRRFDDECPATRYEGVLIVNKELPAQKLRCG
jgi:hypothetical protein